MTPTGRTVRPLSVTGDLARQPRGGAFAAEKQEDCTLSLNAFISTAEEMSSVKVACEIAPSGRNKDAALVALRLAEAAKSTHREADCLLALSAATAALAREDR